MNVVFVQDVVRDVLDCTRTRSSPAIIQDDNQRSYPSIQVLTKASDLEVVNFLKAASPRGTKRYYAVPKSSH
jgi:hypothetical protein